SLSPDGRWLAYGSTESQPPQFFVRPFSSTRPLTGGPWQISKDGGQAPIEWSANGKELSYLAPNGAVYVVSYTVNGDTLVASPPRLWSAKSPPFVGPPAMLPDGKRFIVVLPSSEAATARQTHISVLLNFADELHRRTLAGK